MAETKEVYVGVKEPVNLRRNLLESSKGIVQSLKDYEKLKLIREDKHKKILEFKNKINEILILLSALKENFPKEEQKEHNYTKKKMVKTKNIKIKTDEINQLEKDLAEIESRLSSM